MLRLLLSLALVSMFAASVVAQDDELYRGTEDWSSEDEGEEGGEEDVDTPPGDYPVRYTLRPLTLNRLRIRGDAVFNLFRVPEPAFPPDDHIAASLAIGGAIGVTDDLEIGVSGERMGSSRHIPLLWPSGGVGEGLIGLHFSPDFDFGDIPLYARFRFLRERVQMAAELALLIPTNTDFQIRVGVPIRLMLADAFVIDTGVMFGMVFGEAPSDPGEDFFGWMDVPIRLVVSPIEMLSIGLHTGLRVVEFQDTGVFIPLGFEAIVSMNISTLLMDFFGAFDWPAFWRPADDNDTLRTGTWNLTFGARVHFQAG